MFILPDQTTVYKLIIYTAIITSYNYPKQYYYIISNLQTTLRQIVHWSISLNKDFVLAAILKTKMEAFSVVVAIVYIYIMV